MTLNSQDYNLAKHNLGGALASGATTSAMSGGRVVAMLDISTGSVSLEAKGPNTGWIAVSAFTADAVRILDYGDAVSVRLNCTSATSAITYDLIRHPVQP